MRAQEVWNREGLPQSLRHRVGEELVQRTKEEWPEEDRRIQNLLRKRVSRTGRVVTCLRELEREGLNILL